ncbi:MAG: gliding motility-associated C-terminal domain-containing protein, partial [Bacteroidia bacterium]|nr:gliding motility-associated C-terminal domain-containing protein [Bacteroidia bacterium]
TVVATDIRGCQSSTTAEVFIDPLPEGYLKGTLEACAPFSSDFYFQKFFNGSDHITASWELNGKPVSSKSTFTYSFTSAGDYVFTGHFTDTLSSCINSNTFVVKALSQPTANFAFEPAKPIEGMEPVLFTNTSEGTKLNKFNWYFIDNDGFSTVQKNTSYHFTNAGKYPVVMVVADGNGCKDSIIKTVEVAIDFAFYAPNAFTPNEDDKNEIFIPVIRGVKFYEIMIFNRWGERIFRSTDLTKGWDGTFKGESCQQGSYVWKVNLTTTGGEEKFYSGSVLLYR